MHGKPLSLIMAGTEIHVEASPGKPGAERVRDMQGEGGLARAGHPVNEDHWRAAATARTEDRLDDMGGLGVPADEMAGWWPGLRTK
jgi:hypothetical protein